MQNARCYRRAYVVSCMTCAVHAHSHHNLSGETGGGKKRWKQQNANKNACEDASAIFFTCSCFFFGRQRAEAEPTSNPCRTRHVHLGPSVQQPPCRTHSFFPSLSSLSLTNSASFSLPLSLSSGFQPLYFRRKNVNARAAVPFTEQLICLLPTNARFRAYYKRTHGRGKWNKHLHVLST